LVFLFLGGAFGQHLPSAVAVVEQELSQAGVGVLEVKVDRIGAAPALEMARGQQDGQRAPLAHVHDEIAAVLEVIGVSPQEHAYMHVGAQQAAAQLDGHAQHPAGTCKVVFRMFRRRGR